MDLETKYNYYKWALYIIPLVIAIVYFLLKFQKDNIASQISKQKELKQEKINHLNFQVSLFNGTKSERIEFANSIIENDPILKGINYGEYLDKTKNQEELSIQKALSYYITDELDKAQSVSEFLLTTEINDYDKAVINALLGKIYLNKTELDIDKTFSYLNNAEFLFNNKLIQNDKLKNNQKAALFIDFAIYYKKIGDSEKAKEYYDKSLKIYNDLNIQFPNEYDGNIALLNHNLYIYFMEKGEFKTALPYLKKAIAINAKKKFLTNDETNTLLKSISSIINHFSLIEDWKQVDYFIDNGLSFSVSLEIENSGFQDSRTLLYNNIGNSYNIRFEKLNKKEYLLLSMENLEKARSIYLDRITKGRNISSILLASIYHGMGNANKNLGKYKDSLEFYEKSIEVLNHYDRNLINKKGRYSTSLANVYMDKAQLFYFYIQDNINANKAVKKAIDLYELNILENPSLEYWLNKANEIFRLTKNN